MSAILTADMEGFSTWMQRDEQAVIELLTNTYYRFAEEMVRRFHGTLFQKEGDAIWCSFQESDEAIQAGLWLLKQFVAYNKGRSSSEEVRLRVGVSWGGRNHDVLQEAKKLESSATPGAVHYSEEVHQKLAHPEGHQTGRFSRPTFEVFCDTDDPDSQQGTKTVIVAKLSYLGPSAKMTFLRACFRSCKQEGGEFFLGAQGWAVGSYPSSQQVAELPTDMPYLQTQVFHGISREGACFLAKSRWVGPQPAPISLERTDEPEPELPHDFRIVLEAAPATPYKFLSSYRLADSLIFYGRDQELASMQQRLVDQSSLLVYGKSGVGKTSILRAGLQAYGDHSDGKFLMARIMSSPRKVLSQVFKKNFPEAVGETCEELWKWIVDSTDSPLFLILDEFEELFIRCTEEQRADFVNLLRSLLQEAPDTTRLIVSLREDYLAELFDLEHYWDGFLHNRMRMKVLDARAARSSIVGPAELFGLEVEEQLCERLIESLYHEGVHPAELQIVLDRLYREAMATAACESQTPQLSLAGFQKLGGVGAILAAYLDDSLSALPVTERERAKVLLKHLVTDKGTREAVTHKELVSHLSFPESAVESLLRYLIDARLIRLVVQTDTLGYELSHTTLVKRVREWETPVEVARRHAQIILRNEFRSYRRVGSVLSSDRLALLMKPGLELSPGDEERLMLVKASALHTMDPAYWMQEAAHQQLCYPILLQMLEDEQLEAALRRELIVTIARLPLEGRALDALFRSAVELANPSVLGNLADVSDGVRERLKEAVRERYFGEVRTCLIPEGTCLVGSSEDSKQARLKVTRPDLHSRILSERVLEEVHLQAFRIDKMVVSNAEYAEFQPLHRHFFPVHEADYPAVNVSHEEAVEYAQWLGKRLPTEEEWEKAARGCEGQKFPWGSEFDSSRVNSGESERRAPLPVGELTEGASPFGCLQMSGNVWEWTSTPWEPDSPLIAKKGGCALNFAPLMHCSARYEDPPEMRLRWAGFRLVSDVKNR